jgi:Serine hydrolase (FSH1)
VKLLPADIPGFTPPPSLTSGDGEAETDSWGWFKRETGSGLYIDLERGLDIIAEAISDAGGIDGVIGFSQGGCMAAFVASLLEPGREKTFSSQQNANSFPYPSSFTKLQPLHPEGLKFCVSYSGFYAPNEAYRGFYEPKIKTRFLNVIGSLDSVVEESRSLGLSERVEEGRGRTVYHPGGHFVPIGKEMAGVLVGFLRECCVVTKEKGGVEDMDVPF